MTRVLIVDDHPAVRAGLEALLAAEPGLTVQPTVATAADAEASCRAGRPDVLVADFHLPDIDGLALCLRLAGQGGPPVVLFSAFADDDVVVLAIVAGARAVVQKAADPHELIAAVHAVARGGRALPTPRRSALEAAGSRLAVEDLPVFGMLVHGIPPDEIARTLGISEDWLQARRWAVFERLRGGPARRSSRRRERPGPRGSQPPSRFGRRAVSP